ncbi:hypothetical protein E3N88_19257 [Mikania micrantha]|uniref:Uncharacterized protein n=1 Tax=Mikania micrantha TaxID=192012 RepID=A0A5N6NMP3_9ASTR|nr:hypothetical protein E3N88_19257 [Mikania micrantha]
MLSTATLSFLTVSTTTWFSGDHRAWRQSNLIIWVSRNRAWRRSNLILCFQQHQDLEFRFLALEFRLLLLPSSPLREVCGRTHHASKDGSEFQMSQEEGRILDGSTRKDTIRMVVVRVSQTVHPTQQATSSPSSASVMFRRRFSAKRDTEKERLRAAMMLGWSHGGVTTTVM